MKPLNFRSKSTIFKETNVKKNNTKKIKKNKLINIDYNIKFNKFSKSEKVFGNELVMKGNNITFKVPTMDSKFSAYYIYNEIYKKKFYESKNCKVKENDIVLDIGANIGLFT